MHCIIYKTGAGKSLFCILLNKVFVNVCWSSASIIHTAEFLLFAPSQNPLKWWIRTDSQNVQRLIPVQFYTIEPSLFWAGIMTGMAPIRLRLGPAILLGGGMGAWLGGLSYSSEGILSYWGLLYSCRLEGDMEPREERWLPTLVKLRAVETRLFGGGTSSLLKGGQKNVQSKPAGPKRLWLVTKRSNYDRRGIIYSFLLEFLHAGKIR